MVVTAEMAFLYSGYGAGAACERYDDVSEVSSFHLSLLVNGHLRHALVEHQEVVLLPIGLAL